MLWPFEKCSGMCLCCCVSVSLLTFLQLDLNHTPDLSTAAAVEAWEAAEATRLAALSKEEADTKRKKLTAFGRVRY